MFVLTFARDLKREKSLSFGFIAIIMCLIRLILLIAGFNADHVYCISNFNILLLLIVMNIMINGKYMDKAARGRDI